MKHTPLPWHSNGSQIIGKAGRRTQYIADISRDNGVAIAQENAAFIIEACNNYERVRLDIGYLTSQLDACGTECKRLLAENSELREALKKIAEADPLEDDMRAMADLALRTFNALKA